MLDENIRLKAELEKVKAEKATSPEKLCKSARVQLSNQSSDKSGKALLAKEFEKTALSREQERTNMLLQIAELKGQLKGQAKVFEHM